MTDASAVAGTHRQRGLAWVRQAGGVRPRRGRGLQGRYLYVVDGIYWWREGDGSVQADGGEAR
ncbi:MAG: hypothetical protein H0V59_04975 [Nocardioidaceae bacterium]|nr:hypothetical protein [Nocardioidaceae bacterium]